MGPEAPRRQWSSRGAQLFEASDGVRCLQGRPQSPQGACGAHGSTGRCFGHKCHSFPLSRASVEGVHAAHGVATLCSTCARFSGGLGALGVTSRGRLPLRAVVFVVCCCRGRRGAVASSCPCHRSERLGGAGGDAADDSRALRAAALGQLGVGLAKAALHNLRGCAEVQEPRALLAAFGKPPAQVCPHEGVNAGDCADAHALARQRLCKHLPNNQLPRLRRARSRPGAASDRRWPCRATARPCPRTSRSQRWPEPRVREPPRRLDNGLRRPFFTRWRRRSSQRCERACSRWCRRLDVGADAAADASCADGAGAQHHVAQPSGVRSVAAVGGGRARARAHARRSKCGQ